MTRKEAFEKVISIRGVHNKLGITSGAVRRMRTRLKENDHISDDAMRDVLEKYGASLKQEEVWEII